MISAGTIDAPAKSITLVTDTPEKLPSLAAVELANPSLVIVTDAMSRSVITPLDWLELLRSDWLLLDEL